MLIDLRLLRPRRNGKSTDESEKRYEGGTGRERGSLASVLFH